ncbi:MAG: DUF1896 family protein [Bacteroidia bacterium]|nr:DUF1896 family protein [Bacteroidia bacterium]
MKNIMDENGRIQVIVTKPLVTFTEEEAEEMHETAIRNVAGIYYNELVKHLKEENPFVLDDKQAIWDRAELAARERSKMMQEGGMQYPEIECETKKILFAGTRVSPFGMVMRILNDMEFLKGKSESYKRDFAAWICLEEEFQKYCKKHAEFFGDPEYTEEYEKFEANIKKYVDTYVHTHELE